MNKAIPQITVLIPAYNEEARIVATVRAARGIAGVERVLVIDDGSTDATARCAAGAGAEVLRLARNGGKGAALRAGLAACPDTPQAIMLLLDADLGETAAAAAALLPPVINGEADLAIARFPRVQTKAGFGLVKGLARWGTWALTRHMLAAPISGQRVCRRWVLAAAPIADGYGVEVAMNVAAGDAGARIVEVPVPMTHHVTGRTLRGFQHRGRQYVAIFAALAAAALGRTGESLVTRPRAGRMGLWLLAVLAASLLARPWTGLVFLTLPFGVILAALLSGMWRVRRLNFARRYIPALGGMAFALVVGSVLCYTRGQQGGLYLTLASLLVWTGLGLLDDVMGASERKGFRGHLSALAHGRLTGGGIKLLGGGVLALAMAWALPSHGMPRWLNIPLAALLIALSANALNLFDLRPGRALKVCWLSAAPLLGVALLMPGMLPPAPWLPVAQALLLASVLYAPLDFAGMMMLGDTGANPLGAFLGLTLALLLPGYGQAVAVLLLLALHLYAERASLTRTIERVPALRWVDLLGRDR